MDQVSCTFLSFQVKLFCLCFYSIVNLLLQSFSADLEARKDKKKSGQEKSFILLSPILSQPQDEGQFN